jgi:hypothetical protein
MRLSRLQVTIEPWIYPNTDIKQLKIRVQADGKEYNIQEALRPNDFDSVFDMLMDRAKYEMKKHIDAEIEEAKI